MPRKRYQSVVEVFVAAYLTKLKLTNKRRHVRAFIEKAIILIDMFLGNICCAEDPEPVTYTRRDDELTNFIRSVLVEQYDVRKNRKSLEAAKVLLQNALEDPCCIEDEN